MKCKNLNAIMSTTACINRQQLAIKYKNIILIKFKLSLEEHSLIKCLDCEQGKAVKENPEKFVNKDFIILKNKQIKEIEKRGWRFKSSINYESLFDNFDCSMIQTQMKRRKNYGKGTKSIATSGIMRFVRKHRNITRSKQNIFQSIKSKLKTK